MQPLAAFSILTVKQPKSANIYRQAIPEVLLFGRNLQFTHFLEKSKDKLQQGEERCWDEFRALKGKGTAGGPARSRRGWRGI